MICTLKLLIDYLLASHPVVLADEIYTSHRISLYSKHKESSHGYIYIYINYEKYSIYKVSSSPQNFIFIRLKNNILSEMLSCNILCWTICCADVIL